MPQLQAIQNTVYQGLIQMFLLLGMILAAIWIGMGHVAQPAWPLDAAAHYQHTRTWLLGISAFALLASLGVGLATVHRALKQLQSGPAHLG